MKSSLRLLTTRQFAPFFWVQFLGALNDNVFKIALITWAIFAKQPVSSFSSSTLATLLPGIFILPFFLFSALAGELADKYEKSMMMRSIKLLEIFIMVLAAIGFAHAYFYLLVFALFLMGVHSSFFGPVKYAYLPEKLPPSQLIGGNGLVEMGTFIAILLGQILGAFIISLPKGPLWAGITVLSIATLGYLISRMIPHTPSHAPALSIDWQILRTTWKNLQIIRKDPLLKPLVMGISWFWFYGATLLAQLPEFAKTTLAGDESRFTLLLTLFSVGVGLGSILCEQLARLYKLRHVLLLGGWGLTIWGIDLYVASFEVINLHRIYLDFSLIGFFGGLYVVPLYTQLQLHSRADYQSRVIAGNNILNAGWMVFSAIYSLLILHNGLDIRGLFLITALLNMVVIARLFKLELKQA
jgi:MFS family permease